jgi:hypothetical protein
MTAMSVVIVLGHVRRTVGQPVGVDSLVFPRGRALARRLLMP